MLRKIISVGASAWILLAIVVFGLVGVITAHLIGLMTSGIYLYVAQPVAALIAAAASYGMLRGQKDRIRRKGDKATIIASVMVIWFVLYFLSGLLVTYVHNSLVVDFRTLVYNLLAYGLVAACMEYTRYAIMLKAGRRNAIWFGMVVATVFAIQQVNLISLGGIASVEDFIKFFVANIIPGFVSSMLLTYLAFTAGLAAQLTYRLGTVLFIIIPPIIPKFDWYLIGISSLLLSIAVYVAIDRHRQDRETRNHKPRRHHVSKAYDIVLVSLLVALATFTAGLFTYKPVTIMSDSMKPVYGRGAVVIIRKTTKAMDIQLGDIIQYQSDNITVTHRVVAIDIAPDGSGKRVFTTKGDNSPDKDLPVMEEQLLGIVRAQIPNIGFPTVWLRELTI